SFEYNLTGGVSCPDAKQTISIQINSLPLADAGIDAVLTCAIADAVLGGNSSAGANIKYEWQELGGGIVANPSSKTIKVNQEGEYEIKVSDAITGCFSKDTVIVMADNQVITAVPSTFDDPSCFKACDGFITIDPSKISGGKPPFELSLNGGAFSTKFDFQDLCDGVFNIVVRDQSDCEFAIGFTLKSPPDIQVDLGPDQVITGDIPIIIKPIFSIPIADIVTIVVVDEDGAEVCAGSDCSELILQPTETTSYTITVTDANGCSDSDQMNILVAKEQVVFVPSGFTPNGDGQNDVLMIFGSDLLVKQIKSFQIFNRWGDVLFLEKNFPINDPKYGWDGKFKGQKLNPGVFVYVAEVEFLNGEESQISGDVTISGVSN
ncbi:MAG: gliding motility-associated C-terminal domain-containing protein, partial [Saprospiraceae bacterium]